MSEPVGFVGVGTMGGPMAINLAQAGGKIAICGSTSGAKMELTLPHLFFKQLEFIGSSMSTHGQFARATTWVTQSAVEFPVSRVFDFAELPDALRFLDSGEQLGKVALSH